MSQPNAALGYTQYVGTEADPIHIGAGDVWTWDHNNGVKAVRIEVLDFESNQPRLASEEVVVEQPTRNQITVSCPTSPHFIVLRVTWQDLSAGLSSALPETVGTTGLGQDLYFQPFQLPYVDSVVLPGFAAASLPQVVDLSPQDVDAVDFYTAIPATEVDEFGRVIVTVLGFEYIGEYTVSYLVSGVLYNEWNVFLDEGGIPANIYIAWGPSPAWYRSADPPPPATLVALEAEEQRDLPASPFTYTANGFDPAAKLTLCFPAALTPTITFDTGGSPTAVALIPYVQAPDFNGGPIVVDGQLCRVWISADIFVPGGFMNVNVTYV